MTSPSIHHVAVWLDQKEARVFHIEGETFEESTLHAPRHHVRRHPDHLSSEREHPDDARRFFRDVAGALEDAGEVLVVGPSTAKLHFLTYLHGNDPKLAQRIIGVETVDHPTDGQLAAHARHYFVAADRALGLPASARMTASPRRGESGE